MASDGKGELDDSATAINVKVPPEWQPGLLLEIEWAGTKFKVAVPAGVGAGDVVRVNIPSTQRAGGGAAAELRWVSYRSIMSNAGRV